MSTDQRSKSVVRGLPKWILGVAAVFVFANILLFTNRSEQRVYPSVGNPRASGLAVLLETLRAQGFEVVQDRSSRPVFRPSDVILWPRVRSEQDYEQESDHAAELDPDTPYANLSPSERSWAKSVAHVKEGGTTLVLEVDAAFRDQLATPVEYAVVGPTDAKSSKRIKSTTISMTRPSGIPVYSARSTALPADRLDFVTVRAYEKGRVVSFENAAFLTNRLIDQADSADVGIEIFRRLVPAGSRIVVIEAALLNVDDPSLWQAIGPYASAAYWQFIGLSLLVIYTLARRFGPPYTEPVPAQASRELVDAYGHLLFRARRWDLAAKHIHDHLDLRCRRALRLSAQASTIDRNARAGEGIEVSMRELLAISSGTKVSPKEFKTAVQAAWIAVENLERESRGK